jgi:hypothetical protein
MGAGIGFCGIGLELVWVGGYGRGMRETNGLTTWASWSETIVEFEGGLESLIDALKKFRKVEESIGFRIEEILFKAMAFDEEKFKRVEEELNDSTIYLHSGEESPPLRIECSEVIVDYLRPLEEREEQINVIFSFKVLREDGIGHDDVVVRINPRLFGPLKREQAFVCELLGENANNMLLALMEAGKNTWNLVGAMRALYSLDRNYDKILLVEELKKLEWMDAVDEK